MDLNKTYQINIISQTIKGHGSFLVVERFNDHSSQHFQNYYQKLHRFNQCYEWFQYNLDYPTIEIGKVILAQTNKKTNSWSRGIISRLRSTFGSANTSPSEIYFIDTQRISDLANYSELRICPPKYYNLVLPTYNIHVDFGLDDNLIQSAIESLIEKNQYGDISFRFIPQSISRDNIYRGELLVNYGIDNSIITLEKFLKNVRKKKSLNDTIKHRPIRHSTFDPLKFDFLREIFIPKDFNNKIFSDQNSTTSFSELDNSNNSSKSDKSSSTLNNSEYYSFSNNSASAAIKMTKSNCNSINSSMNTSDISMCSFDKTNSPALKNSSVTRSINQSSEKNQNTALDFNDECKLTPDIVDLNATSSGVNVINDNVPELNLNSVNTQEIKVDTFNNEIGVKKLITDDHCPLMNDLKDEAFAVTSQKVVKEPETPSGTFISYVDAKLWWSDSDDSGDEIK